MQSKGNRKIKIFLMESYKQVEFLEILINKITFFGEMQL
jgi:hypothetical protein